MDFEDEYEILQENSVEEPVIEDDNQEKRELVQQFVEEIQKKIDEVKSQITLIIDRFEGDYAVCENRDTEEITNISIDELPENAREGDVLKFENNKYELDEQKRQEIEERIKNKIKNLFEETEEE